MKLSEEIKTAIGFLEDDAQRGRLSCKIKAEHFLELLPKVEQLEQQNNELLEALIETVRDHISDMDNGVAYYRQSGESYYSEEIKLIESIKDHKWSDIIKEC